MGSVRKLDVATPDGISEHVIQHMPSHIVCHGWLSALATDARFQRLVRMLSFKCRPIKLYPNVHNRRRTFDGVIVTCIYYDFTGLSKRAPTMVQPA